MPLLRLLPLSQCSPIALTLPSGNAVTSLNPSITNKFPANCADVPNVGCDDRGNVVYM